MNLFADLLATTQAAQGQTTATGPRIQKRRGVEIKSAREVKIMRQASKIVATVLPRGDGHGGTRANHWRS